MPIEDQLKLLKLDRQRSVSQLAQAWGENGVSNLPDSSQAEAQRPILSGSQLIATLLISSQDLEGRVVGRNNDDAAFICKGLEVLLQEWEALEARVNESQILLDQYEAKRQDAEPLPSPGSSEVHYAALQQSRIEQLERQEDRLLGELREVKSRWESIMAKTMEHQAAIHRQQMRERESLVAQKDAELQQLRQQVNGPHLMQPSRKEKSAMGRELAELQNGPPAARERLLMSGKMVVGQTLQILGPTDENASGKYQWFQIDARGDWLAISGATRNQYSPEPGDRGYGIGCSIAPHNANSGDMAKRVSSKKPVSLPSDLEEWVDALAEQGGAYFGVVVVQKNGMLFTNREVCTLDVNTHNLQLRMPNDLTLQQNYAGAMQICNYIQVCGARGAGSAAAQGVFLAMRPHEVYMLACESPRERNACIMLIRKMAALRGLRLTGP